MLAGRGKWRAAGSVAFLSAVSAGLIALNLAGRSPLNSLLRGVLGPALAMAGELDPPRMSPEEQGTGEEFKQLEARNARLLHEVQALRGQLSMVSKSQFDGKRYPFRGLPAQVVCRAGTAGLRRMLVVDRGSRDGVRKGMGVISGDRVVGRVHRAEQETSIVLLLTDPACKVPCLVVPGESGGKPGEADGPEGVCEGMPGSDATLRLRHIPLQAPAAEGDAVVSSGLGGVFPPGLSVGTIERVSEGLDLFQEVELRPSMGASPLRSVLILIPSLTEMGADAFSGNARMPK